MFIDLRSRAKLCAPFVVIGIVCGLGWERGRLWNLSLLEFLFYNVVVLVFASCCIM